MGKRRKRKLCNTNNNVFKKNAIMKTYNKSKKTIEKLMKKNGKKTWWIILAALIVAGIQACGSTWNLRENQINVEVNQNSKHENRGRKKCNESKNKSGSMDGGFRNGEPKDGGNMETNGSNEQSLPL